MATAGRCGFADSWMRGARARLRAPPSAAAQRSSPRPAGRATRWATFARGVCVLHCDTCGSVRLCACVCACVCVCVCGARFVVLFLHRSPRNWRKETLVRVPEGHLVLPYLVVAAAHDGWVCVLFWYPSSVQSFCATTQCSNHGTCHEELQACICDTGYTGIVCQRVNGTSVSGGVGGDRGSRRCALLSHCRSLGCRLPSRPALFRYKAST